MTYYRTNTQRRFGESDHYHHARINGEDYLFTDDQLRVARIRAKLQPEDVPRLPWWRRWLR